MNVRTAFLGKLDALSVPTRTHVNDPGEATISYKSSAVRRAMREPPGLAVDQVRFPGDEQGEHTWHVNPDALPEETALRCSKTVPLEQEVVTVAHEIPPNEHSIDIVLATTSHELTSPLTVLGGSLQLAERWVQRAYADVAPDQQHHLDGLTHVLQLANQQIDRMIRLVNDLQDSTRIHTGNLRISLEPADLAELVDGVVAEQRLLHPRRVFRVVLPLGDAVIALVDAGRVGQVLTNYLNNAVKYTPTEQPIEIQLCITDTMIRVNVRDHGPGLTPAQQQRIWGRFQQGHAGTEGAEVTGLGLGLYISRVIVEQHGGCVGVESTPGQGATFWFEIPLIRATPLP